MALTINHWSSSEIGSPTTAPQLIVGDEMSFDEREREFSKSSHLVWRMVEQNENGFSFSVCESEQRLYSKMVF